MSNLIDMTGKTVGNWYVIERAPNRSGGRSYWKCKCLLCNKTIKEVSGHNLRTGQSLSCGCQKMSIMREACKKDETGKIYGYLEVLREATEEEKQQKLQGKNKDGVFWVCKCLKCGNPFFVVKGDYLRNGDTKSCGCLNSYNESKIFQMLKNNNINFKQQFTFNDLTSSGRTCDKLMFDFAIFNKKDELQYLIEYDGEQHFLKSHAWDIKSFQTTIKNDNIKNIYCFNHNIPLIRIPYWSTYDIKDLELNNTHFLLTKDNLEKYYRDRDNI